MTVQEGDCCEDFQPNMKKIHASIVMDWVHGNRAGYTGKKFVHCPWCGKILEVGVSQKEEK